MLLEVTAQIFLRLAQIGDHAAARALELLRERGMRFPFSCGLETLRCLGSLSPIRDSLHNDLVLSFYLVPPFRRGG